MSAWIERRTADGSYTLEHPLHGETYHSLAGAWTQARERYAGGARLRERALELAHDGAPTLRLLDVGTGLGLNLAAALEALVGTGVALEACGLERDEALLRHAATRPREPADLELHHAAVRSAFAAALVAGPGARVPLASGGLRIHLGDAQESLDLLPDAARFDAVFLDPFSPRVEPRLWSRAVLGAIARRMAPGSQLSTYSAAIEVRAGLVAAGLRVGRGGRVGEKGEGTLASPDRDLAALEPRVARRIARRALVAAPGPGFDAREGDPPRRIP